jgi:biotin transport system ATP-binding protein
LLRLIAGLIPASAGQVRVGGIDPATDRRGALAQLGILFQNPDHQIIFPTVTEELAFGLRQLGHKDAEARATRLLARWGRAKWANASISTLSQGQRQFLCLLAVLAMEPATILLDEPFSGLDLPMRARLGRELAGLPQRIVVITHDPAMLANYDRVVWLEQGQLRGDGSPAEVLPEYEALMAQLGGLDADADITP